jgi:hypothetical protein
MTKEQYLMMCEQTGQEVDWEKCPVEWSDFPDLVWEMVEIYNSLGDKVLPDIGYLGKDFTNLPLIFELNETPKHTKETLFDLLLWLDARNIKISQDKMQAEHAKIKQKYGKK